ncbi:unnamed protein product [Heterosigma akashiwo]
MSMHGLTSTTTCMMTLKEGRRPETATTQPWSTPTTSWPRCFMSGAGARVSTLPTAGRSSPSLSPSAPCTSTTARRLGAKAGDKLLDCGCGIGGPYRNIAQFTGADVTGITLNEYQVGGATPSTGRRGLQEAVRSVQGDFMEMPFADESFDGAYAIEATCHAPDRLKVYGEIMRVLKPGGVFACYEWCLTDKYDAKNEEHRKIKKAIEEGDGLPDMIPTWEVDKALEKVGFELLETRDMALDKNDAPGAKVWYLPLMPSWNIFTQRFQFTGVGMWLTANLLWLMEKVRLAPAGTCKVQMMLQQGGIGCSRGGATGTFTPMYLAVVRKPLRK